MTEPDPFAATTGDAAEAAEAETPAFPWPPVEGVSFVQALGETWQGVVLRPQRFFAAMPAAAPLTPAVVFQLLMAWGAAGVDTFWRSVLPLPRAAAPGVTPDLDPSALFLLAGPLALALAVFFAVLVHAALVVFGARRAGPQSTLRVLCYASAPSMFALVPWAGVWVGAVWSLVLIVIGMREVHGTSTARATAAVLAPVLGCAFLIFLFVMLVVVVGLSTGVMSR